MTKKTRSILVLILTLLFFILASFFITFAQGYRVDLGRRKLVKTGGLYIKTQQTEIDVYLNGKLRGNTGQIFKNALIQNLHPKLYNTALKKKGYLPWEKNLEIKESLVTEIKNVYLFPRINKLSEDFKISDQISGVSNFSLSPDGRKIIIAARKETGGNINNLEIIISDLSFANPLKFSDGIQKNEEFSWSYDSRKILLKNKSDTKTDWFLIDLEKSNPGLEALVSLTRAKKILWRPKDPQYLFVMFEGGKESYLYKYNLKDRGLGAVIFGIKDFELDQNNLFWLDAKGFLLKGDFDGKEKIILNPEPIPNFDLKSNYKIIASSSGKVGIIENENVFYLFDGNKKVFEKISEGIKKILFVNSSKIFYWGDYEIWAMFLEDYLDQPQRKKGDKELVFKSSEKITNLFVFQRNEHIIFKVGNQIKIAELDSRDKRNIMDFSSADGKIYYNNFDKKLYILDKGNLHPIAL